MRGFVSLTDESYVRGVQTLVHSIRRWYPEVPICIGCVNLSKGARADMKHFAERHQNVKLFFIEESVTESYTWFYKAKTILESGFQYAVFMDADSILTYTIPEIWEILEAGFIWGARSRGTAPDQFKRLMTDEMWLYLAKNPTHMVTGCLVGFDVHKWRDLLETWDKLCFTPDMRSKAYGDMGLLNYLLVKRQLLHKVHFSQDNKKYGALNQLKNLVEYTQGLVTINTEDSRGLVKMIHYNGGKKPWNLMDKNRKAGERMTPKLKRLHDTASMKLWRKIYRSMRKGDIAWKPDI